MDDTRDCAMGDGMSTSRDELEAWVAAVHKEAAAIEQVNDAAIALLDELAKTLKEAGATEEGRQELISALERNRDALFEATMANDTIYTEGDAEELRHEVNIEEVTDVLHDLPRSTLLRLIAALERIADDDLDPVED